MIPLDLPSEAVRTYEPRGPLQQYRLASAHPFSCWRCAAPKTAKLVTVVDGDPDRLLCNGCYGRLLALWEIKAGDLPDAERDLAVLELLTKTVPASEITAARLRLQAQAEVYRTVSPQAQLMLATAEAVSAALRQTSGLDWSAAIICLCKAVELEAVRCVAEPWRDATVGLDLADDMKDKDLARVSRYFSGRAPAPELGPLAYTLTVAARSQRRRETSRVISSLWRLVDGWRDAAWVLDPDGLPWALEDLSKTFRNPAAHTSLLAGSDYLRCREMVLGSDGLLSRLAAATTPSTSR